MKPQWLPYLRYHNAADPLIRSGAPLKISKLVQYLSFGTFENKFPLVFYRNLFPP